MSGAKPKDFTGMRFGKLTAIRDVGEKNKSRVWLFSCDCGGSVERVGSRVASYSGVPYSTIRSRIRYGWTDDRIIGEAFK